MRNRPRKPSRILGGCIVRVFIFHFDGVGGGYSRALYINASGKIAGFSRTAKGYDRAFLWTPNSTGGGSMVEIPGPAGWSTAPIGLNQISEACAASW